MRCHEVLKVNEVGATTAEDAVPASLQEASKKEAGDKTIKTQEANQTPGGGDDAVL